MKKLRVKYWLIASLSFLSFNLMAQVPTVERVEKLLMITNAERISKNFIDNLDAYFKKVVSYQQKNPNLSETQKKSIENYTQKIAALLQAELSWPSIKPIYIRIYQKHLTQDEVNGLIDFYQSPAGAALTNKMPLIVDEATREMELKIEPIMKKMDQYLREELRAKP